MNQFPPPPQSIPLRPFRIFSKIRGDIRDVKVHHQCQHNNTWETGGKICRRCRWYQRQFSAVVVDTGGKFVTGVIDNGGAPCHCEYLREFSKKFETVLLGENWFMEKTRSKNPVTLSL